MSLKSRILTLLCCWCAFASLWYADDYLGHPWDYLYKSLFILLFMLYPGFLILRNAK